MSHFVGLCQFLLKKFDLFWQSRGISRRACSTHTRRVKFSRIPSPALPHPLPAARKRQPATWGPDVSLIYKGGARRWLGSFTTAERRVGGRKRTRLGTARAHGGDHLLLHRPRLAGHDGRDRGNGGDNCVPTNAVSLSSPQLARCDGGSNERHVQHRCLALTLSL